jgi:chromosome segregation ATPase
LQDNDQKIDHLRSEQATLAQQIQAAGERITKLEKELTAERANLEEQQARRYSIEAARENATKRENEAAEQLNEIRLALATEGQRYENLVAQRKPMSARATELSETVAARETEIVNFEERLAAQAAESKSAETAVEKQIAQRADLEATVAALINQRTERSSATNEMESNVRAVRNSLNELRTICVRNIKFARRNYSCRSTISPNIFPTVISSISVSSRPIRPYSKKFCVCN